MNARKRGSNQYKKQYKIIVPFWKVCLTNAILLLIAGTLAFKLADVLWYKYWSENIVISPLSSNPFSHSVYAKEPTPSPSPEPTLQNIIAYIVEVFEPEGKETVVWAINCFYSESGLRHDAYNYNTNGTEDRGVAQVNSIHGLTPDEAHDFRINIDTAYQVYKRQGRAAWYGSRCGE